MNTFREKFISVDFGPTDDPLPLFWAIQNNHI